MNILITYNDSESYLERNRLFWKLSTRPTYQYIVALFSFGLIVFVIGLLEPYSFSSDLGKRTSYYDFHFSLAVGTGFCLLSFIYLYHLQRTKAALKTITHAHLDRANKVHNQEHSFLLTTEFIEYSNFEEVTRKKWSAFSFYRIRQGFIVLYQESGQPTSFMIKIAELNEVQQKEFSAFLQKNVYQKA